MIDIKPKLRDAVAFAVSLPTDQAHLCGYSWGPAIAWQYTSLRRRNPIFYWRVRMQAALDRAMIENLPSMKRRQHGKGHQLSCTEKPEADEQAPAIEGLRYLGSSGIRNVALL
jgi:pimeloyl-ACP methyl ester carboxylesterase